jgi:lipopolysaccharide export system protein LptA
VRWQSVARAVVALTGIGCAVWVYVSLRPRDQIVEPTQGVVLDNSATAIASGTKVKRVDDTGRVAYSMEAGERVSMADGRTIFKKGVTFKFSKGDVRYTVTGTEAEASGKSGPTGEEPSTIVFRQKVKMVGDDGFSVESEDATYLADEQRVAFPSAVSFTRDRIEGKGVGADLFMDRSVLWLNDQAEMTVKPANGGVPIVVYGKKIGLAQNDGYLRAEENARLTRESQQLFADAMTVYFAEGTQSVRRIELAGNSRVRRTGAGKRPDMQGNNIDLDFNAENNAFTHGRLDTSAVLTMRDDTGVTRVSGSVIDFYVGADGETLTKLDVVGPTEVVLPRTADSPARTITSNGLVAEGKDPQGLDRAVFSGGTQYREMLPAARGQAAAVRLASSQSLVLSLDGGLDKVSTALFRQEFCFVGPLTPTATPADAQCAAGRMLPARGTMENTMAAAGDEGQYDARAESLKLRATGPTRPSPRVANRDIDVRGRQLDIDIKQDAIDGRGVIEFTKRPDAASAKATQSTGLFEDGKPIVVRSNTLKYSKTTGLATYGGNVTMTQQGGGQESSVLRADEISVDDQKKDIKATGSVRSTFLIESEDDPSAKKGPTLTVLNSDGMTYTEAQRRAIYTGKAVMESGQGQDKQRLTGHRILLDLQPERRALKWMEADAEPAGFVLAKLPDGRQATGLRLTYDAVKQLYVVTGKPAQVASPTKQDPNLCDVGTGSKVEFPRTGGTASVTSEGSAQARTERDARCSEVIRK